MDDWLTPFDGCGIEWHEGLPSPYTYQPSDFSKLVAAVHEYEVRCLQAERERDQARDALAAIDEEARQAKIAVESVTIDQPVGVTENVAIYHFGIVRTRARAALGGAAEETG